MGSQLTREQAKAISERGVVCGALSKSTRRGAFFVCTNEAGHDRPEHTACDGNGHVLARWRSETSLIEIWLPDGYHLV